MIHIRLKNSELTNTYTVVITDGWDKPLEEHISVVEHPELYEIVDCEIPEQHQNLIYISDK